jgi:hypothetical protein
MTTYKEIFGKYVKNYSSDPSSDAEGQIWYNTTSGTFKTKINVADSWSSGGNLNTARDVFAGSGTQTATTVFGGRGPAGDPVAGKATELYNGTTWTNSGNMSNIRRYARGCGTTQTAALAISGNANPGLPTAVEAFNGSTWTAATAYPFGFDALMCLGSQTAALAAGGPYSSIPQSQSSYKYNGTSWTASGNLNNRRSSGNGIGTQTAGLIVGGYQPPVGYVNYVESFDGTSFSNGTAMPRAQGGGGSAGTQTAALMFGNDPSPYVPGQVISYNGSSWSTSPTNLNTQRGNVAMSINGAPSTAAIAAGGNTGPATVANTELYTVGGLTTKTITTS